MITLPRIPFIIAEIGINHNGDVRIAKKLVDIAKNCGCDAVKFQKRSIKTIYADELSQPRESPWGSTQGDQKKALEFGKKEYDTIDRYCRLGRNIPWFASAWDIESLTFLDKYDPQYQKVASAMITHEELLREMARRKKLTFISTGMSTMPNIELAVKIFRAHDCPFILMHCVSVYANDVDYPEILDEIANLSMIQELRNKFDCDVGYSSHTVSYEDGFGAVLLGAIAIEKHITFNRAMWGSDQSSSLEQNGLRKLVHECRKNYLGDPVKQLYPEEERNAKKLRYWE